MFKHTTKLIPRTSYYLSNRIINSNSSSRILNVKYNSSSSNVHCGGNSHIIRSFNGSDYTNIQHYHGLNARYYSTNTNSNQDKQHFDLDSLEDSIVNHNTEEFQRNPKFYWFGVTVISLGVLVKLYYDYIKFDREHIRQDIKTIEEGDSAQERNEALLNILSRASCYYSIENLFKENIVDVLVKAIDDSDPAVQSTAIRTLTTFMAYGYEIIGEEAVKKGLHTTVFKIIYSNNMNSDSAVSLWMCLMHLKNNQKNLLNSQEFINSLNSLAHADKIYLQEVAVETIRILFSNRDNYELLPKLKGILGYLHKSKNALISNYCEQYLGVLDGKFIPPVGTDEFYSNTEQSDFVYKIHCCLNFFVTPLTYFYCSYRWSKYTNDHFYKSAKGLWGGGAALIAGILASIALYPTYNTRPINQRISDIIHSKDQNNNNNNSSSNNNTTLSKNNGESKDKLSTVPKEKEEKQDNEEKGVFGKFVDTTKNAMLSPNGLFTINLLFPVIGNITLLRVWRTSRYTFLPSLLLTIPYSLQSIKRN